MVVGDGAPELKVIDFQDALLGTRAYDLVALLRDSYVVLTADEVESLVGEFVAQAGSRTRPASGGCSCCRRCSASSRTSGGSSSSIGSGRTRPSCAGSRRRSGYLRAAVGAAPRRARRAARDLRPPPPRACQLAIRILQSGKDPRSWRIYCGAASGDGDSPDRGASRTGDPDRRERRVDPAHPRSQPAPRGVRGRPGQHQRGGGQAPRRRSRPGDRRRDRSRRAGVLPAGQADAASGCPPRWC